MKRILLLLFAALPLFVAAQNVKVKITLKATEGGVHSFMNVTLVNVDTKEKFTGQTDATGVAVIEVPPNGVYDMLIPNYTAKKQIKVPNAPGATMTSTLFYSKNMLAEEKAFAMTDAEKAEVDNFANGLPDTTRFKGPDPFTSYDESFYSSLELQLSDFDKGPLAGEVVTLIGRKRHKAFKGTTDANGKLMLYLPKGDEYDLSFKHHKNFESTECKYSIGTSEIQWSFEYIGTKKYEKNLKDEEDRQKAEIAAIAKAKADAKQANEAARKANLNKPYAENDVAAVMDRNNFSNPLIICDASADMTYIVDELQAWFAKNAKTNPNAQFVFFNDGDFKASKDKKVGETGGLYYTASLPIDKLYVFMNSVLDKGNDNDGPDNYVEALIKGVAMAKQPYSDIILIVDNHATARDMSLLSQFNKPVHVVVFCSIKGGCDHSFCQPDFMKIAYKTKGTLHINGQDFNDISRTKSGDEIHIGSGTMKMVNGEFFQM